MRANEWERCLSRQRERNTHKQWRADNEVMKGSEGARSGDNDGADFKATALATSMSNSDTEKNNNNTRGMMEGRRRVDTDELYQ